MSQADEPIGAMHEKACQERSSMPSAAPQVGIFYVIDAEICGECTPMLEGEDYGDFKTHPNSHLEYWPFLAKRLKMTRHLSYDYYPRGRVNYSKTKHRYFLYLDHCLIKNRKIIRLIKEKMHLSDQKVEVLTDEHYQCAVCNPNYIPDVI